MNQKISVVIITKNEEKNIVGCIDSAKKISEDVIVIDCGSADSTCILAKELGAKVFYKEWKGYGAARNYGAGLAKNEWILSLDADEIVGMELVECLKDLSFENKKILYGFSRHAFIGKKRIKHGAWGRDMVWRLYNQNIAQWDNNIVHEKIISIQGELAKIKLVGYIEHYTVSSIEDLRTNSSSRYIKEVKKVMQGKKKKWIKKYTSPAFRFIKEYILLLGFLDGKEGWYIACMSARYAYAKYSV